MEERQILLTVSTPDSERCNIRCDSVRFSIPDGKDGKIQSGSVGIRRGHAEALMAVAPGRIEGFSEGRRVFACVVTGGLAVVGKDRVSILTDRVEEAAE